MTKKSFNLKNAVTERSRSMLAIAICLAGMTMFSGCDKDNGDDNNRNSNGDYTIEYRPGLFCSGQNYTQAKKAGVDVMLRDTTYTRMGFRHVGWSRTEDGESQDFYFDIEYWDDEDIILYPHWRYDQPHYELPTNVRAEYTIEESSGMGNMKITAIKIGDYYFCSKYSAFFAGSLIREFYYKPEGGRWQAYERYISDDEATMWMNTGYISDRQDVEGEVFDGLVSESVIFEVRTRLPVGKETIVGVQCDKYVISSQQMTQKWDYIFLFDPVFRLNFKVASTIDDVAKSTFEVKVWNTSVTGFGDIDLP